MTGVLDTRDALALSERKRDARNWREKRAVCRACRARLACLAHDAQTTKEDGPLEQPVGCDAASCEP
jgi:hypothetical protein